MYTDPGANAFDTLDDPSVLTLAVVIAGERVNTLAPAFTKFNVSYNVNDAAGNPAYPIFRTVIIGDGTPPVLNLTGERC